MLMICLAACGTGGPSGTTTSGGTSTAGGTIGGSTSAGSAGTTSTSGGTTGSTSAGLADGMCRAILSGALSVDTTQSCAAIAGVDSQGLVDLQVGEGTAAMLLTFNCRYSSQFQVATLTGANSATALTWVTYPSDGGTPSDVWTQALNWPRQMNQGDFTLNITSTGPSSSDGGSPIWTHFHGSVDSTLVGATGNSPPGNLTLHLDF
jgi:hypothetical protein